MGRNPVRDPGVSKSSLVYRTRFVSQRRIGNSLEQVRLRIVAVFDCHLNPRTTVLEGDIEHAKCEALVRSNLVGLVSYRGKMPPQRNERDFICDLSFDGGVNTTFGAGLARRPRAVDQRVNFGVVVAENV